MDAKLSKPMTQIALPALFPSHHSAADHDAALLSASSQRGSLPAQPEPPAALDLAVAVQPEPPLAPAAAASRTPATVAAIAFRSADNPGEACDRATLDELRAEGGALLEELAGIFQAEVAMALSQLACALDARDCAAAARIAHTLKGSAGIFGAAYMQELAAQIDQAARAGGTDQAAAMFAEFGAECERVRRCLAAAITA